MVHPSFVEPEIIIQYSQASGAFDLIQGSQPRVRIASDDLAVYMKYMRLRTKIAAAQSTFNELPGVDIMNGMISTPTYLTKVRSAYDHHDVAAGARWGFSVPEAYRLGMRQANFQLARDALLYGFNPQNGEGLLNTNGASATNLPPDQNGNDTVVTYDNGAMAFFLAQRIQQMKTRTLQMGIARHFSIVGPQETLGSFEYNVVQLTQFQRDGAGTASTKETLQSIIMANGDTLSWGYDDTLKGKGAGGTDAVVLTMPEIEPPKNQAGQINTNDFSKLTPGNRTVTTQYCDMAAPREIISPLAGGATDNLMEWRFTSGWGVRPEGVDIISMQYQ
jgi:hypothetical protein